MSYDIAITIIQTFILLSLNQVIMKVYLVIKVLFYISRVHPHCYCGVEKVQVKSRNNVFSANVK